MLGALTFLVLLTMSHKLYSKHIFKSFLFQYTAPIDHPALTKYYIKIEVKSSVSLAFQFMEALGSHSRNGNVRMRK